MANPYLTPEQQKQINSKTPAPAAPAAPAPKPATPPNPLAGIDYAIGKQKASVPAAPVSFNGGQVYNPTTAPYGFDQSAPGVNEQFWNNNQSLWLQSPELDWVDAAQSQFNDPWTGELANQKLMGTIANPGAGQQYWAGIQGSANTPTGAEQVIQGGYKSPNNAQTAFGMTQERMPGAFQPQFDAYYDRMKDKVMSDVNSQSAARGAYGSNYALNNSIGAGLDVEAQRAKASTDFMFQDSANQMAWLNSLANQGRGADLSGLGIYGANMAGAQYGLDKTKTMGDLAFRAEDTAFNKQKALSDIAFGVDEHRADRLGAGISTALASDQAHRGRLEGAFDASNIAQGNREDRINTLYGQNAQFSNDVLDFVGQNYDALLGGDQAMSEQQIQAMIAQTADQRGWDQQTQERIFRDVKTAVDAIIENKAAGVAGGKTS